MQETLAGSVPAQRTRERRPGEQPAVLPVPSAGSSAGSSTGDEPRGGGLPRRMVTVVLWLDVLVVCGAVALAWPLRGLVPFVPPATADGIVFALRLAPLLIGLWVGLVALHGGYRLRTIGSGPAELQSMVKASVVSAFAASTACYFSEAPLSRGFLVCAFALGTPLLLAERVAVRSWIRRRRLNGSMTSRVLAVGTRSALTRLREVLDREPSLGYRIVGCTVTDVPGVEHRDPAATSTLQDIRATCERLRADTVMMAGGDVHLREVAWALEGQNIELIVVPNLRDIAGPRLEMRPVAGLPFLHVEEPQARQAGGRAKRLFDFVFASVGLVAVSPLMVVVAACIKLGDGGPVFYRQVRVGLDGSVFGVWKFRSMSVDADEHEAELRAATGHQGALFKLEHDPRITRIGRFIRRYSIDELPQLLNVISGTMSLVGPRPHQEWEVATYTEIARRRLNVRPGMTGLWQVSGRSRLTWEEALRLDLYYRDNWSMLVDLAIMTKTVKAVLSKDGAY